MLRITSPAGSSPLGLGTLKRGNRIGSNLDTPASSRRGGRALSRPRNNKHDDDDRRDDGVNAVGADGQAKEIDE